MERALQIPKGLVMITTSSTLFPGVQSQATPEPRNLLEHQIQIVLRNIASDIEAFKQLFRLAWAWRHQRDIKLWRTLAPSIILASFHLAGVIALGVMSSRLVDAGDIVTIVSPWCGNYENSYFDAIRATNYSGNATAVAISSEYLAWTNSRFILAQRSVDMCQASDNDCYIPRPKPIRFKTVFVPDKCPVGDALCHPDAGGSMSFDTGFISSHDGLGYNAEKKDRVSFRLQAECAPLRADGFVTEWQTIWDNSSQVSRQLCDMKYGKGSKNSRNATVTLTKRDFTCDEQLTRPPFLLIPHNAFPLGDGTLRSSFTPIQELYPNGFDLSLIALSYQTVYSSPVDDPWFHAQQLVSLENSTCRSQSSAYTREYPLTGMACTQKWQVCSSDDIDNPSMMKCTDPAGILELATALTSSPPNITLSPRQRAITNHVTTAAGLSSFYYTVLALSRSLSPPLKVRNVVASSSGIVPTIPPDQWRNETTYWMELIMSYFQRANLDYSTGQFAASTQYINVTEPASRQNTDLVQAAAQDAAHWLCRAQTIQNKEYRNFDLFRFGLIVGLCVLITFLGWFIEDISGLCRTRSFRYRSLHSKLDLWRANSDLDMLRRITELLHGFRWTMTGNGIPVTHVGNVTSATDLLVRQNTIEDDVFLMTPHRSRGQGNSPYGQRDLPLHRCGTCSTFAQSSDDTTLALAHEPAPKTVEYVSHDTLTFNNEIEESHESFLRSKGGVLHAARLLFRADTAAYAALKKKVLADEPKRKMLPKKQNVNNVKLLVFSENEKKGFLHKYKHTEQDKTFGERLANTLFNGGRSEEAELWQERRGPSGEFR
ncbi:hypothetical protein MRB53_038899 [Persea americana]|nr:hypothetical protein MRB53_038899 [Persea americana]